jgi:hypothetical protein
MPEAQKQVSVPLALRCPICNVRKPNGTTHCSGCLWAIDKLQDLSRHQLKAKLLPLVKEIMLIKAALA